MGSDITSGRMNHPNPIDAANKVLNHIWENDVFVSTKSNTLEERTGISYLIGLSYIEFNRPRHFKLTELGKKSYLNGGVKADKWRKPKIGMFPKFINNEWFKNIFIAVIGTVIGSIVFLFLVFYLFRGFVV